MRYNKIRKMDISNGPGIRVSIFVQGCTFNCKDCFNPETHNFEGGKEFCDETMQKLMELCGKDYIAGLSILGGEPLHPNNIATTKEIAYRFHNTYKNKNLWLWSGFQFEDILKMEDSNILDVVDVLVDGQFKTYYKDYSLKWRGSSNQRVIDVKKSLNEKRVIELDLK